MAELSIFAAFYILAQIVERIIEVVSEAGSLGKDKRTIESHKRTIDDFQKIINKKIDLGAGPKDISDLQENVKLLDGDKGSLEMRRIVWLWGLASLVGVVLCFIANVGFFKAIGVVESVNIWDKIGSGLLVGSGTKPLHDVIAKIEKTAKKE